MDVEIQSQVAVSLGKLSAAFAICLSAMGSAVGTGAAGMAAAGAWRKCYTQNKIAPFMLVAFVGLPLTQTCSDGSWYNSGSTAYRPSA